MTKKLITAGLVGLAVVASAPAFAASGNIWEQQVREQGGVVNPYTLPSNQAHRLREFNDD